MDQAIARSLSLSSSQLSLPQLRETLEKLEGELDHLDIFFSCNADMAGCSTTSAKTSYTEISQVECGPGPINRLCRVAEGCYLAADSNGSVHGIRLVDNQWTKVGTVPSSLAPIDDFRLLDESSVLIVSKTGGHPVAANFSFHPEFRLSSRKSLPELNNAIFVSVLDRDHVVTADNSGTIRRLQRTNNSSAWKVNFWHQEPASRCIDLRTLPNGVFYAVLQNANSASAKKFELGPNGWEISQQTIAGDYSACHITAAGKILLGFDNGLIKSCVQNEERAFETRLGGAVTLIRSLGAGAALLADDTGRMRIVYLDNPSAEFPVMTAVFSARKHEVRDVQVSSRGEILSAGSDGFVRVWG